MRRPDDAPATESRPSFARFATSALRAAAGLTLGIAACGLLARCLGIRAGDVFANLSKSVQRAPPWFLVGCAASGFVILALQSLRRHLVMRPLLGLTYARALRAQIVGTMFNAFVPARGGDLLRVEYLARRSGKPRGTILGTEVVDRWLDWWGWIPVALVLALPSGIPRWMLSVIVLFSVALGAGGLLMVVLSRRAFVPKPGSRLGAAFRSFQLGVNAFGNRRTFVIALAVAPLPWLWETFVMASASRAFGLELSFTAAFSALIGLNLAMVIPSPGALGSVEAGGVATLALFSVDQSKALAFVFVYHLTQLLPTIAAGVAILVAESDFRFFGRKRARAKRAPLPIKCSS